MTFSEILRKMILRDKSGYIKAGMRSSAPSPRSNGSLRHSRHSLCEGFGSKNAWHHQGRKLWSPRPRLGGAWLWKPSSNFDWFILAVAACAMTCFCTNVRGSQYCLSIQSFEPLQLAHCTFSLLAASRRRSRSFTAGQRRTLSFRQKHVQGFSLPWWVCADFSVRTFQDLNRN